MKYAPIKKSSHKVPPHLLDYEQTYKKFSWEQAKKEVTYFADGTTNIAYNALDRHRGTATANKTAMVWVSEKTTKSYTYEDLCKKTNQFANVLNNLKVQKGDRVFMFLPRI